jgi:hypothetical protein
MKRQPDGTWRGTRQPVVASAAVVGARWIEAETVRLKQMGLAFDAIAERISRVGRGQATPLPAGVSFRPDYTITRQACHKAFHKAIAREPSLEIEELRRLDLARCEEMYMNLQSAVAQGRAARGRGRPQTARP